MVTEFGAEANREGPVEEKGTWAFQQDFVNYHLGVFAQQAVAERRGLLGAERVPRQARLGGRQPAPGRRRVHQKGLLTYDDESRKPAWADVQRFYSGTNQYP